MGYIIKTQHHMNLMDELTVPLYENEIVAQYYENNDNYKVIKTSAKGNRAIIFFSGHGIYSTVASIRVKHFVNKIVKKDYYEWMNISKSRDIRKHYSLIIFVRDINICWYIKGINKKINTQNKVINLLKNLTKGYEVVTCGNSAGGYMAVLAGIKLKAKKIYNFSGLFKLQESLEQYAIKTYGSAPVALDKYFEKGCNNMVYFLPYCSEYDKWQYDLIKKYDIEAFKFNVSCHGGTVEGICYPKILTMPDEKLQELLDFYRDKIIDQSEFTKKLFLFKPYIRYITKKIFSVSNAPGRSHKVITILGFKIKFKRK